MRRKSALWILTLALLAGCLAGSAGADTFDISICDSAFELVGHLASGHKNASVFDSLGKNAKTIGRIGPNAQLRVLSEKSTYYEVEYEGQTAYVSKSRLALSGIPLESAPVSGIVQSSTAGFSKTMIRPKDEKRAEFTGSVTLSVPVQTLTFFVYDERQFKLEQASLYMLDAPAQEIDAALWRNGMHISRLSPGRKTFCVEAIVDGKVEVIFRAPFFIAGEASMPATLNSRCTFTPKSTRVQDSRADTCWTPTDKRPEMTVVFPADEPAALVQLEWYRPPEGFEVTVFGAEEQELYHETLSTGFYVDAVSLPEGSRKIVIRPFGEKPRLSSLWVYGEPYPRDVVQQWEPIPEKVDMMVFSAHEDDEVLFFSGAIPWYNHLGKKLAMVYMSDCGRDRYREALDGQWTMGLRSHPVFLNYPDKGIASIRIAANIWPGSQEKIVRLIRRYKPDVMLVQDVNGEYGHTQHKLTSLQVREGVALAMDETYDPESAAEYGTWEVKKLYVHLWEENQVHMDWKVPMEEAGGLTPWDIAIAAFEKHHSQYGFFRVEFHGVYFDSSLFGLYHSSVGPDEAGGDFFEHID